jgi:hypothetical protein
MKTYVASLLLAVVSFAATAQPAPADPGPYLSAQPGLELSVRRGSAEGLYEVSAVITDAVTGAAIGEPRMTIRAGNWGAASVARPDESLPAYSLSATVDPSGKLAAYLVHALQADGERRTYSGTTFVAP